MRGEKQNRPCSRGVAAAASTILALALAGPLTGCAESTLEPYGARPDTYMTRPVGTHRGGLTAAPSCDTLADELRAREALDAHDRLEANLAYALKMVEDPDTACYDPYASYDGCDGFSSLLGLCGDVLYAPMADGDGGGDRDTGGTGGAPEADGADSYSTTNNQVAGVDEPDVVKNDDRYVYLATDGALLILEAWPAAQTRVISTTAVSGQPKRLFVHDDRLVLFVEVGDPSCEWSNDDDGGASRVIAATTRIDVFDVTDRAAPRLERQTTIDGLYVNARRVGDDVHAVVEIAAYANLGLAYWPEELAENLCAHPVDVDTIESLFEELRERNAATLAKAVLADFLPGVKTEDIEGGEVVWENDEDFQSCEDFYLPAQGAGDGELMVVSLPVADDRMLARTSILSSRGEVYASHERLFVAVDDYAESEGWSSDPITVVHAFDLGTAGQPAVYLGSGEVPGAIVNQFAMDEYQGRLRIATTEGWMESNNLFVLEPVGQSLEIVGEVRGIAQNEDIRSVRFDGDRGFVVTFEKTDPLFTFDLSDPYAPALLGELEIPGFSTYIHLMDEDHLLTIGFDGDDQGSFSWFQGIILQIFDISNVSAPTLAHKVTIGSRGTSSEATDNHLAFNYFAPYLAIPMAICEGDVSGGAYATDMTFNGLMVFVVDPAAGFTLLGKVEHQEDAGDDCSNWWTDSSSNVQRSIFMEDFVYSLSAAELKVNALTSLGADLVTVDLPASEGVYEELSCSW